MPLVKSNLTFVVFDIASHLANKEAESSECDVCWLLFVV